MAKRHCPGALLAALAASLAGLLLAEAAWGQTFTYSRGWKPGGKRSPQGVPLGPPLGSELAPIAGYVDDLAVEEQQPPPARPAARPPVVYLATVGERWRPEAPAYQVKSVDAALAARWQREDTERDPRDREPRDAYRPRDLRRRAERADQMAPEDHEEH